MPKTKPAKDGWQARLRRKTYEMAAWDWKESSKPYIRSLFRPFGIRPTFTGFDPDELTLYIATLAVEHGLHLYEVPGLQGSDTFGFVLSKQTHDPEQSTFECQSIGEAYVPVLVRLKIQPEMRAVPRGRGSHVQAAAIGEFADWGQDMLITARGLRKVQGDPELPDLRLERVLLSP